MKKSTSPTPKEIFKNRIANNKQLKVAGDGECYIINAKEIEPLQIKADYSKTKFFKAREKDLKEDPYHNPYALPESMRFSTKCLPPRKPKKTPFIMDEPHTVCDIDPMFYKVIEGRPIRSFCDIKEFMRNLRDITLLRADCAYLKDKIIQIEAKMTYEKEEYEGTDHAFENIESYYVNFIEETYKKAKYMQNLADEKALQLEAMADQLEACSFRFHKLNNMVSNIVGTYKNLSRYKNFLNSISPNWWRERNEDISELGGALCSQLFNTSEAETVESVTDYKKNALALAGIPPRLYFKKPIELIIFLEFTSRQCLNYMEIDTYFSKYLSSVRKYKKDYTKRINAECTEIKELIESFTEEIRFSEERKTEYKDKFFKILLTEFQRLFASYESTKLFTCLQYVHTRIFGVMGDPKDSLSTLMEDLEKRYSDLCINLDNLNQQVVKEAERQIFTEDIRVMRRASNAARQLKEYHVICRSLYKSFEPPSRKTRN